MSVSVIDIVILSHAKNNELRELTERTINSCIESDNQEFHFFIMEQNPEVEYKVGITAHPSQPFNYNAYMNIGIEHTGSPYVCLCNNDLIFSKGWATNILDAMKQHELLSASPICPKAYKNKVEINSGVYFGYRNSWEVSGWCIMTDRTLYDTIGRLDESFPFWFADNIYSEQLKRNGIRHGLVSNSVVEHIGSKTLETLEADKKDELTFGVVNQFVEKHPTNESALYFKNR